MSSEGPDPLDSVDRLDEDHFDVVISGTDFEKCLLAGALACAGKKVLHVDPNDYYGDHQATLPWSQALDVLSQYEDFSTLGGDQLTSKFLIDLQPGLLFARSDLVEDMIRSGTHHYLSFRAINSYLTIVNDEIVQVPISKTAIFQCPYLSRPDKRRLMKLMHLVLNDDRLNDAPSNALDLKLLEQYEHRPFAEYLDALQLSPASKNIIIYSLCLSLSPDISTSSGMQALQKFVNSLGRFDAGALLYPVYGTGDFPQAFARFAAVYGATYLLRTSPSLQPDNSILLSNSQRITCDVFVRNDEPSNDKAHCDSNSKLSRCVCVCSKPIEGSDPLSLLVIPPGMFKNAVHVIQVDEATGCVPKGAVILYLSTLQGDDPKTDLLPALDQFMPGEHRLATIFFTERVRQPSERKSEGFRQIDIGHPSFNPDLDLRAATVRSLFHDLCQEASFMKRADSDGASVDLDRTYNPEFDNILSNTEGLTL